MNDEIIEKLSKFEKIKTSELSEILQVSKSTILKKYRDCLTKENFNCYEEYTFFTKCILDNFINSNKLITIDEIREMIANATDDKLKLIIKSVFEEDYDGTIQFANAVFASIHVLENMSDGDEYVMNKVYSDIYKILTN